MSQAKLAPATEKTDADWAVACLEQTIDYVANTPLGAGLYSGLAGVGWTLAHVGRRLWIEPDEETGAAIDEILYDHIGQTPWIGEYDPSGYYNLGVAHGVPGVIALLGRAMAVSVAPDKAYRF